MRKSRKGTRMTRKAIGLLLACLLLIPLAAGAERTLYLSGCIDEKIQQSFKKENPDAVLKFDDEILNPDEIITRLLTEDTTADLYHTFVDSTFAALVRKGYAMDLSASRIITDDVNRMYPNIRKAITDEKGNPVAYPWELETDTWKVNITWWRAVFGDEALPETYAEFFRTMIRWEEEYVEQYPEYDFAGGFDYSYWVRTVMNAFEAQYASYSGGTLVPADLGNPLLAEVLDLIDQVRAIREEHHRSTENDDRYYDNQLIDSYGFNNILMGSWTEELLSMTVDQLPDGIWTDMPVMSFEKGKTAPVNGQLSVWFVNPYSENRDLALRYLEHAARCENNPRTYYGTHPDMKDPIPDEWVITRCNELKEELEQLRTKAGEQEEINPELEQRIRETETDLLLWENHKWEISEEAIREYRGFAENIAFHEDNPYVMLVGRTSNTASEMEALFEKYRYGQLSREESLRQYQSRMNMILAEGR